MAALHDRDPASSVYVAASHEAGSSSSDKRTASASTSSSGSPLCRVPTSSTRSRTPFGRSKPHEIHVSVPFVNILFTSDEHFVVYVFRVDASFPTVGLRTWFVAKRFSDISKFDAGLRDSVSQGLADRWRRFRSSSKAGIPSISRLPKIDGTNTNIELMLSRRAGLDGYFRELSEDSLSRDALVTFLAPAAATERANPFNLLPDVFQSSECRFVAQIEATAEFMRGPKEHQAILVSLPNTVLSPRSGRGGIVVTVRYSTCDQRMAAEYKAKELLEFRRHVLESPSVPNEQECAAFFLAHRTRNPYVVMTSTMSLLSFNRMQDGLNPQIIKQQTGATRLLLPPRTREAFLATTAKAANELGFGISGAIPEGMGGSLAAKVGAVRSTTSNSLHLVADASRPLDFAPLDPCVCDNGAFCRVAAEMPTRFLTQGGRMIEIVPPKTRHNAGVRPAAAAAASASSPR